TEGYEGFYHLISVSGNAETAEVSYIIRDFDKDRFGARKETVEKFVQDMQDSYGENNIVLDMNDQYYNMCDKIEPVKDIVDIAYQAMENLDKIGRASCRERE